jgi:glycine cleavage system H lipoate-binding protein
MQYCAAAPVAKMIPYSESLNSRCGNDSHRYCELYLGMAHPDVNRHQVDGIAMPDWLRYSRNHMWLDVTDDGMCHAGLDAFLCRALGTIDEITFVKQNGRQRPAAVIRAAGLDFEMVFPNPIWITACNLRLRANPARIVAEPFTGGWLFEGRPDAETGADLLEGAPARVWMQSELERVNQYLQECTSTSADGGIFADHLARHLDRGQTAGLYHEFFSLATSGRKES